MRQCTDTARSGSSTFTIAHELLLLACAEPAGEPRGRLLERGVAGGLLGELSLRGLVRLAPAAVQLSPIALDALPWLRAGSPALGSVLEQLLATREPYAPAEWIAVLSLRGAELRGALLRELQEAGVLSAAPPAAALWPLAVLDRGPLQLVREQLRAVVLHGMQAEPRARLQLSLMRACRLEGAVLQAHERRRAARRVRDLTHAEPIGAAVQRPREPHAGADWRAQFPEGRFVEALAWLGLPGAIVDRLAFFWRC